MQIESKFSAFIKENDYQDYTIRFRKIEAVPQIPDKVVYEDMDYRVYQGENGQYLRSFSNTPWDDTVYAVATYDYAGGVVQVDYLEKGARRISEIGGCFAYLSLEELLLRKERLCLHASCVDTSFGGILFSGPSGIGKSTQSELWCNYRNGRLINGDRPILSKNDTGWLAWGSPYAGSSRCHVNENCEIRAIVMLKKGSDCQIRRLSVSEAFRKVWSGLTVHNWDVSFVVAACDLAQELVETVSVYELICTPDEQAVICLEDVLRKECQL